MTLSVRAYVLGFRTGNNASKTHQLKGHSAFGAKQTFLFAPHLSAFRGKADMVIALRNVRL